MGKNFGQLKTSVQTTTPTDADTGTYLNDAQVDLVRDSKREKNASISTVGGKFSLPADCLFVRGAAWDGDFLIQYQGKETPDLGTGDPEYWKFDQAAKAILLFPSPSSGSAELIYCPRPAAMSADGDLPALDDADSALIAYAKWQIYVKKEDVPAANLWQQEYEMQKFKWLDLDGKINKRPIRVRQRLYR